MLKGFLTSFVNYTLLLLNILSLQFVLFLKSLVCESLKSNIAIWMYEKIIPNNVFKECSIIAKFPTGQGNLLYRSQEL